MGETHPLFSRFYRVLSEASADLLARHREELLSGLEGRVLEVGCGNGLNFTHYPESVSEVVAIEPEPYLRDLATRAAVDAPVTIRVESARSESLPFDESQFDAVVFSLVLCSVSDQASALNEAFRVLRPGGSLRYYEHVLAPTPKTAAVQRAADTVWPRLFGGCHTARDTGTAIRSAGFENLDYRRLDLKVLRTRSPISPHILGSASRPL
jgi:ubiquinone/menaquinone biosynthesis C-methylase UbiE